ncbi:MAG: DUF4386 domain-containing protein [Candidatus Neomarinimicrobiota bacterium]
MNSPKKTARIAGFLYLIMVPFAVFGIMWGTTLIVPGDAAATVKNIMASATLYRLSILSALAVQIGHLLLVLILYKLLKPVNKNMALLMVIFLLVSIPITMLNELNRFAVLLVSSGADYLTVFTAGQQQALGLLFLNLQGRGIFITQIFWGLWLLPMGYLAFKSGFLPTFLGVLLLIAGIGYVIDSVGRLLSPNFGVTIMATITAIMLWGELAFPLWLLIKGVNVEQWEKRALESA